MICLLDLQKKMKGHKMNSLDAPQLIFDVGVQDFESRVIAASMEMPIIVDFWAPWCGPCKQMMPSLEKVVMAAGGQVLLAKVNIDENQELAAALRVQSVPTVFAFFQGRPLDAFTGAQPESKIREFVQKLITAANNAQPDALDIPKALNTAAQLLAQGDPQGAHEFYNAILHQDALNVDAYVGMVRCFIEIGQIEQAQTLVDKAPEEISKSSIFAQARTALEVAQNIGKKSGRIEDLEAKIKANENDHEARIDLAYALFAAGKKKEATQALLDSIALDRTWNNEAARTELLTLFTAMGYSDPVTLAARRKLSSLLFS
jgi:putative thioredoxin